MTGRVLTAASPHERLRRKLIDRRVEIMRACLRYETIEAGRLMLLAGCAAGLQALDEIGDDELAE